MKPSAERGGVSRPSSSAWTTQVAHAPSRREVGGRDEVAVVGVHAARPDETDEMQPAAARRRGTMAVEERLVRTEGAVGDGRIDARQVLEHRRPDPRFRWPTSLLPIWPGGSPTAARRRRAGVRPALEEAAPDRHPGRGDGVTLRFWPMPNPSRTTSTSGRGLSPTGHLACRARRGAPGR